jgi:AcrR family transcriptional regulator
LRCLTVLVVVLVRVVLPGCPVGQGRPVLDIADALAEAWAGRRGAARSRTGRTARVDATIAWWRPGVGRGALRAWPGSPDGAARAACPGPARARRGGRAGGLAGQGSKGVRVSRGAPTKAEELLRVAQDLFEHYGIGAVSIDRIREASRNTAAPTVYRNYPGGKSQLVVLSLRRWSDAHLKRLRAALESGADAQERLDRLFGFLARWFAQRGFRGSFVMNTAAELAVVETLSSDAASSAKAAIEEHRQQQRALLLGIAQLAQVPDPEGLADRLQLIVDGAVDQARLVPPKQRRAIVDTAASMAALVLEQAKASAAAEQ